MKRRRRSVTTRNPIPKAVGRRLKAGVVSLVVTAAVGTVGHTYKHVDTSGQHGWYAVAMALTPDVGLLIGVTLLTYRRRSFWGWMIVAASAAFVSWSAFSVASDSWTARIVALAPVGFAAIAAGLLESIRGESAELVLLHAEALAEDAQRTAEKARAQAEAGAAETAKRVTEWQEYAAEMDARMTLLAAERDAALTDARQARKDAADRPVRVPVTEPTVIAAPSRGQSRTVKPQVRGDVPSDLSEAETDVLLSMLGQGEMTRSDIIKGSRRVESTVKAALRVLSEKGYVVSERRGIYRTVTPGIEGQPDGQAEDISDRAVTL